MIDIPTVFILGAGASAPYGYPTGTQLRKKIISEFSEKYYILLQKDPRVRKKFLGSHKEKANAFVDVFKTSGIESIDKFLSLSPSFTDIGKIAITLTIFREEKTSDFYEETSLIDAKQNWYKLLFNHMTYELQKPSDFVNFRENRVAFITFNYDRSLEYYLYKSFLSAFHDKREEIKTSIEDCIPFPIIHVYGKVDEIKWHGGSEYKADFDLKTIEKLSQNIRVIGERTNDLKDEIAKIISLHKRIFFLGFGYADENMDSMGMPGLVNEEWNIYGTAKGMTNKEIDRVRSTFMKNFANKGAWRINPRIENKTCYELLREYL